MEKATKIDLKQRERLVDLLRDEKRNEQAVLEEENKVTEDSILRAYAEAKGYGQSIRDMQDLNAKIKALELDRDKIGTRVQSYGFDVSNHGYSLRRWLAPDALVDMVTEKMAEGRRPIEKALKKYDLAIAHVWTATTGDELQKIVESVISSVK